MLSPRAEHLTGLLRFLRPLKHADESLSQYLHFRLFEICNGEAGEILNFLDEPDGEDHLATATSNALSLLSRPNWPKKLRGVLEELETADTEKILHTFAGWLKALDVFHYAHRGRLEYETIRFNDFGDPARVLFLPPSPKPIETWAPKEIKLKRGPEHLAHPIIQVLELSWHVVRLDHLQVVPDFGGRMPDLLNQELEDRIMELRIGVANFRGLRYDVASNPARYRPKTGDPYWFESIAKRSRKAAEAQISRLIEKACAAKVDLLCFPELTLDPALRQFLGQKLRSMVRPDEEKQYPLLVVAGSFHERVKGRFVNRCWVLDGYGEPVYSQDKCSAFVLLAEEAAQMRKSQRHLYEQLRLPRGGKEDIRRATSVKLFDTPLGRFTTLICLDYCGHLLTEMLCSVGANFLVVPAMTPTMKRFEKQARNLGERVSALSLVANSAWLKPEDDSEDLALLYLPVLHKPEGEDLSKELRCFRLGPLSLHR